MLYEVVFIKKFFYEAEAESEDEAEAAAYEQYRSEINLMAKRKIADSSFDSYEVKLK